MPTNDNKINIYNKRLLSLTGMKNNFLDYLEGEIDEGITAIFQGTSGVLDGDEIELNNSGGGSTFTLDITNASRVIVGTGNIINLANITGVGITEDIPFENTGAASYQVGIKYAEIPDGIEANPATGEAEYPSLKQTYGEKDTPGSVVDNTTYIRLNINAITESGVDHSGRTVRCWLVDPVSLVEAVAYFEGTSAYSGPDNYVDIPYSGANGPLGQDTGVNPPSTTAADYVVFIEGATWKKNTAISGNSDYAFIGTITGGSPPGFALTGQNPVFINTLERAYNGATGSGSGRIIPVNYGAIELNTQGGNTDEHNAQLRLNRNADTADGTICLETIFEESEGAGILSLKPLVHTTGNLVLANAISTVNPDDILRTGAVDWVVSNVMTGSDLCWIDGTATSDGLYVIVDVTATTLKLRHLDGSTPSLTGSETGNATVLRAIFFSGSAGFAASAWPGLRMNAFSGLNEDTATPTYAAVEINPLESDGLRVRRHNGGLFDTVTKINKEGNIETRELFVTPELKTASLDPDGGIILDPQNLDLDSTFASTLRQLDPGGTIHSLVVDGFGRVARPHIYEDHFMIPAANWTAAAQTPQHLVSAVNGSGANGDVKMITVLDTDYPKNWGGVVEITTHDVLADFTLFEGPDAFLLDTASTRLRFMCRYAITDSSWRTDFIGLRSFNYDIGFQYVGTSSAGSWQFYVTDGTNSLTTSLSLSAPTIKNFYNMYFAIIDETTIQVWHESMSSPLDVLLGAATPGPISLFGVKQGARPGLKIITDEVAGNNKTGWLDYWSVWDYQAINGVLPFTAV